MAGAYNWLIRKLVAQFPADPVLQRDLRCADSLEAIVEALALSYARLIEVALGERYRGSPDDSVADQALSNAQAREMALAEILAFFERDRVATPQVQVWCRGPDAVCVRPRELAGPT
mgnify:CR=1 FL=1